MKIDELIKNCRLYNTNDLIIKNLTRDLEWKSDWAETSPAILRLKQEIENAETIKAKARRVEKSQ